MHYDYKWYYLCKWLDAHSLNLTKFVLLTRVHICHIDLDFCNINCCKRWKRKAAFLFELNHYGYHPAPSLLFKLLMNLRLAQLVLKMAVIKGWHPLTTFHYVGQPLCISVYMCLRNYLNIEKLFYSTKGVTVKNTAAVVSQNQCGATLTKNPLTLNVTQTMWWPWC